MHMICIQSRKIISRRLRDSPVSLLRPLNFDDVLEGADDGGPAGGGDRVAGAGAC